MIEQIKEIYRNRRLILFVGAGVSMGLGLPSWRQLVDHMATELGFESDAFRSYGSELTLAEYYRITKGQIGPLRSWMDREWHSPRVPLEESRVHKLIATSHFDLIYTTNNDRWLERAMELYKKPYAKVASVGDLAALANDKVQIVKFHGDFDDDTSIVLDETSYFDRLEFESPLDIKLRADVLGRSVLFIGYSLTDINIRYLFHRMANMWKKSSRGVAQPKSFIFSVNPNPVQKAVLARWNIEMLTSPISDPSAALSDFLERLVDEASPTE